MRRETEQLHRGLYDSLWESIGYLEELLGDLPSSPQSEEQALGRFFVRFLKGAHLHYGKWIRARRQNNNDHQARRVSPDGRPVHLESREN